MKSIPAVGTRAVVFHGNARHTTGGLTKADLMRNKHGHIVSRKASAAAKKNRNLGANQLPKGSHAFVPGGALSGAAPTVRRTRRRPAKLVCKRGVSRHCGKACIPVGRKCHA